MSLSDQRRLQLMDDLEAQLDLPPSVRKLVLKAKQKPLQDSPRVSRSERLGEAPRELLEPVADWAKMVTCPRCDGLVTPMRAKTDRQWGESITYQCHNSYKGTMCNLVVSVSESLFKMTKEDFTQSDLDWKPVALDGQPIVGKMEPVKIYPYDEAPPSPWVKKTVRSAVYRTFWDLYLDEAANCSEATVKLKTTHDNPQMDYSKVFKEIQSLSTWMQEHTGWIIKKNREGEFVIAGRGKGNANFAPFNSAKYRKDFGF